MNIKRLITRMMDETERAGIEPFRVSVSQNHRDKKTLVLSWVVNNNDQLYSIDKTVCFKDAVNSHRAWSNCHVIIQEAINDIKIHLTEVNDIKKVG